MVGCEVTFSLVDDIVRSDVRGLPSFDFERESESDWVERLINVVNYVFE